MLEHILRSFLYPLLYTLPAWIIFRAFRLRDKRRQGLPADLSREVQLSVFYLYLLLVATLTLLPQMDFNSAIPQRSYVNLVPVLRSLEKLEDARECIISICFYNWLGNLLANLMLLFPLGILLPAISPRVNTAAKLALVAFCISASIEVFQYLLQYWGIYRFSDIDDVLLNVAGALAGFFTYRGIRSLE